MTLTTAALTGEPTKVLKFDVGLARKQWELKVPRRGFLRTTVQLNGMLIK